MKSIHQTHVLLLLFPTYRPVRGKVIRHNLRFLMKNSCKVLMETTGLRRLPGQTGRSLRIEK